MHLACGCWEVMATLVGWGGGLSGESLPSRIHNGLRACWCRLSTRGELVDLCSPLGYWAAVSTLPGHSLGWQAPTQARGVSQPSGCHRWCLSCAVVSFPLTVVITLGSSHLSRPPSQRRKRAVDTCWIETGRVVALPWLWPDSAESMAVHVLLHWWF